MLFYLMESPIVIKLLFTTLDNDTVKTVNDTFKNFKDRCIIPLVAGRESIEDQLLTQLEKTKSTTKDIIEILKVHLKTPDSNY